MAASGRSFRTFISHAGPQKDGVAMLLQRELQRNGVSAFLDETSLRLGDAAPAEMEATLRSARIVVAILTPDFLDSEFCMEELHWALHPAEDVAQPPNLLPVFYSSNNVRELVQLIDAKISTAEQQHKRAEAVYAASVGQTFQRDKDAELTPHQKELSAEADRWAEQLRRLGQKRVNLDAATKRTGTRPDSFGRGDPTLVNAIVTEVLRRLGQTQLRVPEAAVDLEERAAKLLPWFERGDVRVLSLWGMGGVGKTTLAIKLFNAVSSSSTMHFDRRVFLTVGQTALKQSALANQQRTLIVLLAPEAQNLGGGPQQDAQLADCIRESGPLLLVLDDLWSDAQRRLLLPLSVDQLPRGSRVVLTSRHQRLLLSDTIANCCLAPVRCLQPTAASELLCKRAAISQAELPRLAEVVRAALEVCCGLPLALEVVGSALRGSSPQAKLDDMRDLLRGTYASRGEVDGKEPNLLGGLQWSYDRLPTHQHRQMFLDAALMLRNHQYGHLVHTWACLLEQPRLKFRALPMSLCKRLDAAGQLFNDLTCASLIECGKDGRTEVHDCLVEMAVEVVQSSNLPAGWSISDVAAVDAVLPEVETCASATRLCCPPHEAGTCGPPAWAVQDCLSRHQGAQLAAIDVQQTAVAPIAGGAHCHAPPHLVYLRLATAHAACMVGMGGKLAVLELTSPSGNLLEVPASISSIQSLAWLSFDGCGGLQALPPSISSLPALAQLGIASCHGLQELSLRGFMCLRKLCFASCHGLQALLLHGCQSLQQLQLDGLPSLRQLTLRECAAVQQLPSGFDALTALRCLEVVGCHALEQLPNDMGAALTRLHLSGCSRLASLPPGLSLHERLQQLELHGLDALQKMHIDGAASLRHCSVTSCARLVVLSMHRCHCLRRLDLQQLDQLQELELYHCGAFVQLLPGVGGLTELRRLSVTFCGALQRLPDSVFRLPRLRELNIGECPALQLDDSQLRRSQALHSFCRLSRGMSLADAMASLRAPI